LHLRKLGEQENKAFSGVKDMARILIPRIRCE